MCVSLSLLFSSFLPSFLLLLRPSLSPFPSLSLLSMIYLERSREKEGGEKEREGGGEKERKRKEGPASA